MSLQDKFDQAAKDVMVLKTSPNDTEKLKVYGLFKQGTIGDCNTDKPGFFDMKGKAKWDSWNGMKGQDKEAAKQEYVDFVATLVEKYGCE